MDSRLRGNDIRLGCFRREMRYFIGIDSSTTATKALLLAETGAVVGVVSSSYEYETPKPLWSEQRPELWWTAAVASIRQVLAESGVAGTAVSGIGLTGQMHGLVLLDQNGEVLRPAILAPAPNATRCERSSAVSV